MKFHRLEWALHTQRPLQSMKLHHSTEQKINQIQQSRASRNFVEFIPLWQAPRATTGIKRFL
jgi:hypothetical protein